MPLINSFPGPCQDRRGSLIAEAGSEEAFGQTGVELEGLEGEAVWGIQMRFFLKSWPQPSDQGGTFLPCKRNEHLIGFLGKINCSAIMHGHSAALMG